VRWGVAVLRVDLLYKHHVQQRDLVQHWQKAAMVLTNACKDGHVSLSMSAALEDCTVNSFETGVHIQSERQHRWLCAHAGGKEASPAKCPDDPNGLVRAHRVDDDKGKGKSP